MNQPQPRGEYTVTHLRPRPECLPQFMPLWERLIAARDDSERAEISALLRPFQYEVGETETFKNIVTTVGKNDLLDKYLKGSAYTQTLVMGLKGAGTAAITDTQASHATWLEQGAANVPLYTAPRKTVTMGSAAAGVSTSPAIVFAIVTTGGTVAGCFINNGGSTTIDSTTGVLFSAGDFSTGPKAVVPLDTLNVTYQLTAT